MTGYDDEISQTTDESGAPAFVVPIRSGDPMVCGRTYIATIAPVSGEFAPGAVEFEKIKAAVSAFTGCRVSSIRTTAEHCEVAWRCHDKCPHVKEGTASGVAEAVAASVATPDAPVSITRLGMVWVQSNWLYLVGGIAVAGLGALGAMALSKLRGRG